MMELTVWVDGVSRVVCGVTDKTSCAEVVRALAKAINRIGRFTLVEKWRGKERLVAPSECPLLTLFKWGDHAKDVSFILRYSPLNVTDASPQPNQRPENSQSQRYRSGHGGGREYQSRSQVVPSRVVQHDSSNETGSTSSERSVPSKQQPPPYNVAVQRAQQLRGDSDYETSGAITTQTQSSEFLMQHPHLAGQNQRHNQGPEQRQHQGVHANQRAGFAQGPGYGQQQRAPQQHPPQQHPNQAFYEPSGPQMRHPGGANVPQNQAQQQPNVRYGERNGFVDISRMEENELMRLLAHQLKHIQSLDSRLVEIDHEIEKLERANGEDDVPTQDILAEIASLISTRDANEQEILRLQSFNTAAETSAAQDRNVKARSELAQLRARINEKEAKLAAVLSQCDELAGVTASIRSSASSLSPENQSAGDVTDDALGEAQKEVDLKRGKLAAFEEQLKRINLQFFQHPHTGSVSSAGSGASATASPKITPNEQAQQQVSGGSDTPASTSAGYWV